MALPTPTSHYTLDRLGEGLYAALASDGGAAIGNAGLVDLGDATLIVDTFLTPSAAEALRLDALHLTGRLPRWVVNTHYHNDHIWGNQVFLPEADLISTSETRHLIQTAGKEEYDEYRAMTGERLKNMLAQQAAADHATLSADFTLFLGYFGGLARDLPRLHVTLPNLVFEQRLLLHGSRRQAELIAFTGAHTGSDAVIYLPEDGVVFMSDLLFVGFHPYLGDGNPERWLEVLRSILDGTAGIPPASRFVPGHGPVGTAAHLQDLVDYIQDCQQIARSLREQGKTTSEDVNSTPIPAAYAGWVMPRFFYANLSFLLEKSRRVREESEKVKPRP